MRKIWVCLAFVCSTAILQSQTNPNLFFTVTSGNPQVRVQGIAEPLGDIVITSSAALPVQSGAAGGGILCQVFYNVNITNAAVDTSGTLTNTNGTLTFGGISVTFAGFAFLAGTTTISWSVAGANQITIVMKMSPNATLVAGIGVQRATITVTGVRANASALQDGSFVLAFVQPSIGFVSQAVRQVATVGPGLAAVGTQPSGTAASSRFQVIASEGFSGSFTTRAQETARSGSEVTQGTRIGMLLNSVAPSVSYVVPEAVTNSSLTLTLVQNGAPIANASPAVTRTIAGDTVTTVEYE